MDFSGSPALARQALRLDGGLNDVVLLPIVLIAIASVGAGISPAAPAGPQWARMAGTGFVTAS